MSERDVVRGAKEQLLLGWSPSGSRSRDGACLHLTITDCFEDTPARRKVLEWLNQAGIDRGYGNHYVGKYKGIWGFNDHPATELDDVMGLLDECAVHFAPSEVPGGEAALV